ncbi:alanine--glyoxylate aminotransferase family protein [Puniceicoccales bacterium CK1056]|uniref:Alanine--glyoxylate aminotransferase family protein n=1 Tax=Oceanipulchritudo coccoides TaxID=2706888 RepID=A0A6B2M4V2_9BACT|nr:alanine--glyoxylate aminotransferase family protein [Oceanipulchritudo coccoides]NDV63114.1 alanine--glyoxylate aminotransferase family protein [Oceanipulchritudo coccoides]
MSYKLFIPGPIEVSEKTYKAMTTPVFGHRSPDFVELYQSVQPGLQELFYTKDPVYLSTSSAWGVMEGAIRNLVHKKVLNVCSGAFSDKWLDVSKRCGKNAEALQYDWGTPVDPADIRQKLSTGEFDTITLIHNETSTGTMNPIAEIMAVIREFPDVIAVVDSVSSFSAVKIDKDALGIDVLLTGSQKALAMPPGLALLSVSERARQRAATMPDRGYYFDFLEFHKNHEKGMTPSTPVIPLIFALRSKLEDIFAEGLEARYARHERLNKLVHGWMDKYGLETLPPRSHASKSLSCIKNRYDWDLPALNAHLKTHYKCVIDGGYGKIKGKTFRISNMGDETDETISELLTNLDASLEALSFTRS